MLRRVFVVAACLGLVAGCSKSGTTDAGFQAGGSSTPGSSAAKGATTTAGGNPSSTTAASSSSGESTTTAASSGATGGINVGEMVDRMGDVIGFTADEKTCAQDRAPQVLAQNQANASDQKFVAGVVAGSSVACAGQPKAVKGLTSSLRASAAGSAMPATQLECVETQMASLAPEQVATLLSGFLATDEASTSPILTTIDSACGTTLAKS